jgi:hypothetical protein
VFVVKRRCQDIVQEAAAIWVASATYGKAALAATWAFGMDTAAN